MKEAHIASILLTSTIMTSCVVFKNKSIERIDPVNADSFTKLNGRYSNDPERTEGVIVRPRHATSFEPESCWSQLRLYHSRKRDDWQKQSVEFKFLSKKKVQVKLFQQDSLIDQKVIRGKFKDGYFYRRPFFYFVPLVPLVYGYYSSRYRIGLAGDALIIDYKWDDWAGLFIIAKYSVKGQSSSIFKKQ